MFSFIRGGLRTTRDTWMMNNINSKNITKLHAGVHAVVLSSPGILGMGTYSIICIVPNPVYFMKGLAF